MAIGALIPNVFFQAADNNGDPASGKKIHTYVAGTTTRATTYSDATLTTPNPNPITLNAAARPNIFVGPGTFDWYLAEPGDVTDPPTSPIATDLGVVSGAGESEIFTITGNSTINIAASQLVYMSDGTVGTLGNWYQVNSSAEASSSGARLVGWTLDSIGPLSGPGSIQIFGPIEVATLGAFPDGTDLYVGALGFVTATPPANQRWIGKIISTRTMFINGFGDVPASDALAGLVTTGAQTFVGTKTFQGDIIMDGGELTAQTATFEPAPTFAPGATVIATQPGTVAGGIYKNVTSVGSSTGGPISLAGDIPVSANVLSADGKYLKLEIMGRTAPNSNNKTLTVAYGGTTVFTTGLFTGPGTAQNWMFTLYIFRTGASAQRVLTVYGIGTTGAAFGYLTDNVLPAKDNAVTQNITITAATATANNDVVFDAAFLTAMN